MINPFTRAMQDDSPGALASELAESRATQDETIRAARDDHATVCNAVIDRGVLRMEAVTQMIAELTDEQMQLDRVINRTSEVERTGDTTLVYEPETMVSSDSEQTQI